MITILGLGNPGEKYEKTRHNVARIVLDGFMRTHAFPEMRKDKLAQATIASQEVSNERVDVVYPETFMNVSGQTAHYLVKKQGIKEKELVVVHDDVSLPLGTIRISVGRGDGGHNGVSSIIKAIDSKDFIRIRIGIAQKSFFGGVKKHTGSGLAHFVLKSFSGKEMQVLEDVTEKVDTALKHIVERGVEHAMQECN